MTDIEVTTGAEPVDGVAFFQDMLNKEAGVEPEKEDDEAEPADEEEERVEKGEPESEEDTEEAAPEVEEESEDEDNDNAKVEGDDAYDMSQAIKVKLPDSGEEAEVTLAELVKGYQRQQDYTRKTQELSEARKALERAATNRQQISERAIRNEAEIAEMTNRYNTVTQSLTPEQWNELRQQDPARYAAITSDLLRLERQIESKQSERQQIITEDMKEAEAAHLRKVEEGMEALNSRIPEWKDSAKREALQTQLFGYLEGYGYARQQIEALADPASVELAYKAMKYDEMKASKKSLAAKKLASAPKMLKPGATRSTAERKADSRRSLLEQVRKTGSAVEYFNHYS